MLRLGPLALLSFFVATAAVHHHHTIQQHPHGPEAVAWLAAADLIVPHPVQRAWHDNLVLAYAAGYSFNALKPFVYSFLTHVPNAELVILTPAERIEGMPPNLSPRVIVQQHALPHHVPEEALPYPVSLRFYVISAFLRAIGHNGTIFATDSRDVYVQDDVFSIYNDSRLHFPRESGSYRLAGPFTDNAAWFIKAYDRVTLDLLGGNYVLNSGTLFGPTGLMLRHIALLLEELEQRWHAVRFHGTDQVNIFSSWQGALYKPLPKWSAQAVHNNLVWMGKVAAAGLAYDIDDGEYGRMLSMAWTHPAYWDLRHEEGKKHGVLYNNVGQRFAVIHLWPGDNPVAHEIVLPFVRVFETGE